MVDNVLSQNEVNALLNAVRQGEVPTNGVGDGAEQDAQLYDLTSNGRIVRGRMPTLDILNQRLGRLMRQSLFNMFRKTVEVTHADTQQVKYAEFIDTVSTPACLSVFRLPPLKHTCLMAIDSPLLFGLVDQVFGGTGAKYRVQGREYSAIELKLIQQLVSMVLDDMRQVWEPVCAVTPEYVRTEVNPQFAGICAPTDAAVLVTFDVELEKQTQGAIKLVIPYSVIEPIRRVLSSALQTEGGEANKLWRREIAFVLRSLNVDFRSLLGTGHLRLRDLMTLKRGDTIRLNVDAKSALPCLVEGVEKTAGWPVVTHGRIGIELDGRVRTVDAPTATLVTKRGE